MYIHTYIYTHVHIHSSRWCERLAEYGQKPHRYSLGPNRPNFLFLYIDIRIVLSHKLLLNILCYYHRYYHRPQFTGTCVKHRGVQFHRIRDFGQYNFNSIVPTSHVGSTEAPGGASLQHPMPHVGSKGSERLLPVEVRCYIVVSRRLARNARCNTTSHLTTAGCSSQRALRTL